MPTRLNFLRLSVALLAVLMSSASLARNGQLVYLAPNAVALAPAAFPADGTATASDELAVLKNYQNTRTTGDCARATAEMNITLKHFFGSPYGTLSDSEVARLDNFMTAARTDMEYFSDQSKIAWQRPRPFITDNSLSPCIRRESTWSYPSGHAAIARLFARLLAKLDPGRAAVYEHRAAEIARDRLIGGVHYPTDVEAGAKLADEVFAALLQDAGFMSEFQALEASAPIH